MSEKTVEDAIRECLSGDSQTNALDFITFLRAEELAFTASGTYLDVHLNGKNICSLWLDGADNPPGPWTIWSDQEPGSWIFWADGDEPASPVAADVDPRTREIAWAHVNPCASCGGDCSPGKRKVVLGKAFDGLCSSGLAFRDPDADALACAKLMVAARKRDILASVE